MTVLIAAVAAVGAGALWGYSLWRRPVSSRQFPEFKISGQRVNAEIVRELRFEYFEDVEYRARVKKRMLEGLTAAQMPPLYTRIPRIEGPHQVLPFEAKK